MAASPPPSHSPRSHTDLSTPDDATVFTLTAADKVSYDFRLTSHMCTYSLFLQTAKDVAATEGYVPVGSAQAVRDYVAYLQYRELRQQLSMELARPADALSVPHAGPSTATHTHTTSVENTRPVLVHHQRMMDVVNADDEVWRSPFLREERLLDGSLYDSIEADTNVFDHDVQGPVGYEARHLDCDRTYALPAEEERQQAWWSVGGGDGGDANSTNSREGGGRATATLQEADTHVSAATMSSGAHPSHSVGEAVLPLSSPTELLERHRVQTRTTSLPSSSSSSVSSPSEASLAAYRAEAAGHNHSGGNGFCASAAGDVVSSSSLAGEPGYGAALALEAQDGLLFIERVLLPHEWRRGDENGPGGQHSALPSVATASLPTQSGVTLMPHQQLRLLELISVADFMGTQSLVELCANYLAAWLMDRTDEDVVQSFLAVPAETQTGVSGDPHEATFVPKYRLTGATSFQEPWLRLATPAECTTAAAAGKDVREPPSPSTTAFTAAAGGQAETKAAKKKAAAAAAASARKSAGKGKPGVKAALPEAAGEGETGPPASTGLSGKAPQQALLSGDQRLSVVRQMKRKGSIMISPY